MKTVNTGYMVRAPTWSAAASRRPSLSLTTEYRRAAEIEAARGHEPPELTGGFFYTQNQTIKIFIAAQRQKVRKLYGIFQQRSKRIADPCYRTGSRTWYLGRYQPIGGLR